MSRIGKHPVKVVDGVSANITDNEIVVKGKLGELKTHIPAGVSVKMENGEIVVKPLHETKEARAMWGTVRMNIANLIKGVSEGFKKELELIGVGYRAQVSGQILKLTLGYSHDIDYKLPAGITAAVTDQTKVTLSGCDKQVLGQVAAEIRSYRAPEPYKGKGVKYATETVLRKDGKKK